MAQAARLAQLGGWSYDARGQRVEASEELCRLLGLAREQVPSAPAGFLALIHPEDRPRADAAIAQAAHHPGRVAVQLRVVGPDGGVRDCLVIADLEPGARPSDGMWLGVVQDVSDRAEAERARDAGDARLRQLLDEMPVAFAAIDDTGVMREWNHEAERITGYTRDEIVGNSGGLDLLYDQQEQARIRAIMSLHDNVSRDLRFTLQRKDGERRIVSWSQVVAASTLFGFERTAIGVDVTEAEREAQRYRTLARHLPNGAVLLYDRELRYVLLDGSDLGALGDESSRMVGRTVFEAAGRELAAQLAPGLRAALEGRMARLEIAQAGRDYEVTCVPLYDSGGRLEGGMALSQNISARKRAEREVLEQRERLASVLDIIPALVVGVDGAGRATFVNPAGERTTGYSADELIGEHWWEAVCFGDERRHAQDMMATMRNRGYLRNEEMLLSCKNGERRMVSWSGECAPLRHDGTPEMFFYGLDVTERNQMQERLVIAERMASLGTLAAGVAHEINNPLCYVLANLSLAGEVMEADGVRLGGHHGPTVGMVGPDEFRALLAEAHHGAERVAKIVADLRMFSRASDQRSEAVDVASSLETCLHMAANELRHRAHVVREIREVPRVKGDSARLGQVFLNLLVNAAQALPEARARSNEVRVSTDIDSAGRVVVEIADNGSGMDPATMRRIFDPFFTTKPIGIGTGLGLAIAHRIVTGLGGEILVNSEPGRGSRFRVVLPPAEPAEEPAPPTVSRPPAPPARILVIDDEAFVGHAIRRALERVHAVTVVTTAAEGMAALATRTYDLILCDLMLPEVSGVDLYAQVAGERPELARRIIFITGGAFTARTTEFLEQVPNPCLDKPFDPGALHALVDDHLARCGPAS